jgi:hypothetical protein
MPKLKTTADEVFKKKLSLQSRHKKLSEMNAGYGIEESASLPNP